MEEAGQRLKRRREELDLRFRDVEEASQAIAEKRKNDEYIIGLSRLSEIENKGTIPSIFRLYSPLCYLQARSASGSRVVWRKLLDAGCRRRRD